MDSFKHLLRWLCVVPGALAGGLLLTFPLHWILYSTLSNFIEPYPALPERILSPFAVGAGFVWLGARIAPTRKIETAVVLVSLWMFVLGGLVALSLFNTNIGGRG